MCQQAICADNLVDLEAAKRIMSKNFIGLEDIGEHAAITLSPEDLDFFSKIPYSEETLLKCQNTHILISGLSASILWVYINVPESRFHFDSDPWWFNESFATEIRMKRGWHLIRRNVLPESINKPYEEKVRMVIEQGENVPTGCELIFTMMLYYLTTGIRLFEKVKTQCSDICIDGVYFHVGFFQKGHIDIRGYGDQGLLKNVGITGIKKAESVP